MDAIGDVTSRIAHIQSQLAALQGAAVPRGAAATSTAAATGASVATGAAAATGASTAATSASFAQALDAAMATAAPSASSAPSTPAGEVTAKGVPVELERYGNGRIPASALSKVAGTGATLWEPAARSLERLRAAAAKDGVSIGINDSYRSYDSQVAMVKSKGLYSQGGLAAQPGTSMHGWGVATDLHLSSTAQSWMRAHADEYGFVSTLSREPWHWQYMGDRA